MWLTQCHHKRSTKGNLLIAANDIATFTQRFFAR